MPGRATARPGLLEVSPDNTAMRAGPFDRVEIDSGLLGQPPGERRDQYPGGKLARSVILLWRSHLVERIQLGRCRRTADLCRERHKQRILGHDDRDNGA